LRWVTVQPVTLKDAPDARWRPGTLAGVFGRLPRLGALAEVRTGLRAGFGGAFGAGAGLRTRLRLLAAALRAAGVPTLMAPVYGHRRRFRRRRPPGRDSGQKP
jgi:hypothetical protein